MRRRRGDIFVKSIKYVKLLFLYSPSAIFEAKRPGTSCSHQHILRI